MCNADVRTTAKSAGVFLYQVAAFIKAFRAASPAKRYAITAVIEEMNGKNPTAVDINALYQQKYTEYMEKELEAHTTE